MILLNQLAMTYGNKVLFTDVSLQLTGRKHYALIGANGTGKSTLFRLFTGEESQSDGTVSIPKEATIGWLKQDQFRYEDTPLVDIVIAGKPELAKALEEKDELLTTDTWDEAHGYRLAELEETIAHLNGYTAEPFAEKLLSGLGIEQQYHRKPLNALSGGYKLRVLLAQTLFQEPDLLLLDEPTNHLDIVTIRWLEKYLQNEFNGLLIFISHDMDFIDNLADYILDIDYGDIRQYSGKYAKFLAEKQLIADQKLSEKKSAEAKIAEMQRFVDRFRAKASKAKQAQARMKMIDKIELPDVLHSSRAAPYLVFKQKRPSGKQILKVNKLAKSYGEKTIFDNLSFKVARGEKIAVTGQNGTGKSTLIKSLVGKVIPDGGTIEWGHEAQLGYFSQDHHDMLNHSMPVLEWLKQETSQHTEQDLRKALGQALFSKDAVLKDIRTLSGGEAARLLLARLMLQLPNVMLLDEPTNHLDLEAIEALAKALKTYPGTVIVVSHNRHFISKVASRFLFLSSEKGLQDFNCPYSEFQSIIDLDE